MSEEKYWLADDDYDEDDDYDYIVEIKDSAYHEGQAAGELKVLGEYITELKNIKNRIRTICARTNNDELYELYCDIDSKIVKLKCEKELRKNGKS